MNVKDPIENHGVVSSKIFHLTTEELKKWLMEYDAESGWYPESPYQGYDVWQYIYEKVSGGEKISSEAPDIWHEEGKLLVERNKNEKENTNRS